MKIGKKYITGATFTTTTLYNDGIGHEKYATMIDSCGTIDVLFTCGGQWKIIEKDIKSVKTI